MAIFSTNVVNNKKFRKLNGSRALCTSDCAEMSGSELDGLLAAKLKVRLGTDFEHIVVQNTFFISLRQKLFDCRVPDNVLGYLWIQWKMLH